MEMQGLFIHSYESSLEHALPKMQVQGTSVPNLGPREVLVKMEAAPCNPSDLMFLIGRYGVTKTLPTIPGWEGTGTVVKAGGLLSKWLVGKRVACGGQDDRYGTWAEYFVTSMSSCVPISPKLERADAACFLVNPLTAYGMVADAQRAGHQTIVKTAAASQVGRMVNVIAREKGLKVINIIRKQAQAEVLSSLGAEHILNQSAPDFQKQLEEKCRELHATVAFEAVSGELAGQVFNALRRKSEVYLYGALSEQPPIGINPIDVIFSEKVFKGFYLGEWMRRAGLLGLMKASKFVSRLFLEKRFNTPTQAECRLEDAGDALLAYSQNMTAGKVLICPQG